MVRASVTDSMPDFTGQLIDNGSLKLLESLGSGAYGKVYRALDVNSPPNKQVFYAVKCLLKPEPGSHNEEFQNREFTLHKMVCDHPNIVTLHRIIYDVNYVYVVLDLCAGGDLFTAITETQVFRNNVQLIKDSFIQLIDAVHYCHENGVFHRDIKPENVLCSRGGTDIRLADFGLSIPSHVSKDFGCGSSYYMSPECITKGLTVGVYSTRHSDIWSLGVILTNMISGRNPWRYATAKDECFAAYLHDKDFLRRVLPISQEANMILKKIFNINPLRRISLAELRNKILEVDTFFMTEEELTRSNSAVRKVAKAHSERIPQDAPVPSPEDTLYGVSSGNSDVSVSSDELYAFNSPSDGHATPSTALKMPTIDDGNSKASLTALDPQMSDSLSSGSDSNGPITPATHAADPAVEVPDLPEGESVDQSAAFPAPVTDKLGLSLRVKKPNRNRTHLLRMAFKRIKDLSSGSGSS